MAKTPNYNLELPDESRNISDEFPVLRDNLTLIDAAIKEQSDAVEGKASEKHQHKIDEIQGLVDTLNKKMSAAQKFMLTDLTDVKGANEAAFHYVLTKMATGFGFSSAIAVLGPHKHKVEDIVGLTETLSGYGELDKANIWKGENTFWQNVMLAAADRPQNRQYAYFAVQFPDGEKSAGGFSMLPVNGGKRTEWNYLNGGGGRVYVDGVGDVARFTAEGSAWFMSTIRCGNNATFGTNGNLTGSIWKNWGADDAFAAISKRIEDRATAIADERKKWCVTDTRFHGWVDSGSGANSQWNAPSGYVFVGGWRNRYNAFEAVYCRQPQVYYAGRGWVPLGGW